MNSVRICPTCYAENHLEASQCSKCGAELERRDTTIIRPESPPGVPQPVADPLRPRPGSLALYVMGEEQPLLVHVGDVVTLGRIVPGSPEQPDIDLTPFQAHTRGVSRRHAQIMKGEEGYYLADLNSTNGTWINEERMKGDKEHPLGNGDMVRLGQLVFFVYYL